MTKCDSLMVSGGSCCSYRRSAGTLEGRCRCLRSGPGRILRAGCPAREPSRSSCRTRNTHPAWPAPAALRFASPEAANTAGERRVQSSVSVTSTPAALLRCPPSGRGSGPSHSGPPGPQPTRRTAGPGLGPERRPRACCCSAATQRRRAPCAAAAGWRGKTHKLHQTC